MPTDETAAVTLTMAQWDYIGFALNQKFNAAQAELALLNPLLASLLAQLSKKPTEPPALIAEGSG